ncbi:hypothetical protein D3C73_1252680 [compost metagenome]
MFGSKGPLGRPVLADLPGWYGRTRGIDRRTCDWPVLDEGFVKGHDQRLVGAGAVPVYYLHPSTAVEVHVNVDVEQRVVVCHHLVDARWVSWLRRDVAWLCREKEAVQFGVRVLGRQVWDVEEPVLTARQVVP